MNREDLRRIAEEAYSQPVAARYERTLAKGLLSAYEENTELRERVGELKAELLERDALIARYENQEEEE